MIRDNEYSTHNSVSVYLFKFQTLHRNRIFSNKYCDASDNQNEKKKKQIV